MVIITAIAAKDDDGYFKDTLALESLTAQFNYFEKKVQNKEPSTTFVSQIFLKFEFYGIVKENYMAFDKKKADYRKKWLRNYKP